MLIFTEPMNLPYLLNLSMGETLVMNLNSMIDNYYRLDLIPNETLNNLAKDPNVTELTWDIAYAEYIIQNDDKFLSLMKIIYPLYIGVNVIILIDQFHDIGNYYMENFVESIMKLIQQRYGYNSYIINSPEDIVFDITQMESSFSIPGLCSLDQDKERMSMIIQKEIKNNTFDCKKDMVYGYVDATIQEY